MVRQEGIEEGKIIGQAEGEKAILRNLIRKKLDKNYSTEQIAEMLEVDLIDVEKIIKELQEEKE